MHLKRLSSRPCSPEGLFQKNVTPSWLGLFSACALLAFLHVEHHNANTLRRSCKNRELAFSLALFCHTHSASVSRWLYGCSLLDVSPLLNIPRSPFPPPSLPFPPCHLLFDAASRSTGLAMTLDFKAPLHSSVTHQKKRAIQWRAKREGGYKEGVYKKGGNKCMKRGHERERGSALDRKESPATKAKWGTQLWLHISGWVALVFCFFFWFVFLRCVQIPHTQSLSHFPHLAIFCLAFPSFLSLEPSVQRGVEACSFP